MFDRSPLKGNDAFSFCLGFLVKYQYHLQINFGKDSLSKSYRPTNATYKQSFAVVMGLSGIRTSRVKFPWSNEQNVPVLIVYFCASYFLVPKKTFFH